MKDSIKNFSFDVEQEMCKDRDYSIPIVMFHSVRPLQTAWHWNHLSYPPELFRSFLDYLKNRRFTTVTLREVTDHIRGNRKLPPRSIALTFDDGYLDNWTVVMPLLKSHGFCGTVFVNPEFVDKRDIMRKQIENAGDHPTRDLLDGFMSWPELRAADSSGVLDIQSHGMTHTWYFSSDRIIDFHHPGDDYPWLAWNERPERKYLWLEEDQSEFAGYGVPVYEHEKAMIVRRCFVSREIDENLSSYVREHGGKDFFLHSGWRELLRQRVKSIRTDCRYESDEEYGKRVEWELAASKEEIGSRLGKEVDVLCWPGGGHNGAATGTALRCGYKAWTVRGVYNRLGGAPYLLQRISIPLIQGGFAGNSINRLVYRYKVESSLGTGAWAYARLIIPKLYALWEKTGRAGFK
jgi:hypothetical protein